MSTCRLTRAALGLFVALVAACSTAHAPPAVTPAVPERASGWTPKPGWTFQRQAVAAANPLAAQAGLQVLREGGHAIDAAVAVQMVLALVEPQSSGIGGGAFLLLWDGRTVQAWDGRETAPAAADERLFLQPDGRPMAMAAAITGGRAVGVPGVVRMLEAVHREHGRLPWARLLAPAIRLADEGFAVSPRLHLQIASEVSLQRDPQAAAFFLRPDGKPWPVGHRLRNPALAAVLRRLAAEGSAALHEGPVAADIVARVQGHSGNPGRMSLADLAAYRPLRREALCSDWRAAWRVCGMPPPSSGHLAVMQILKLMDAQGASSGLLRRGVPDADWLHAFTEASRLAFADRNRYVADPAFAPAPGGDWMRLLDDGYLRGRATLIGPRSLGTAPAGVPPGASLAGADMPPQPEGGTSHVSIVDADGNAVALTTSIEAQFGARLMSDGGTGLPGGFLLNNQLTDFSLLPADAQGRPIANRVQPGKRPRSSMSPTLVFDRRDGALVMSLGSPGGAAIIHFVAKTLLGTLDAGLTPQQAIDLPNAGSFNGPTVLERGRFPAATLNALRARGHGVVEAELPSGLQALQRRPAGWLGGADPRREGEVRGE